MSSTFVGATSRPGDTAYDDNRAALRADLDPRPALVVRAAGVADIRSAVRLAREQDLPFAVQSTGHGTHTARAVRVNHNIAPAGTAKPTRQLIAA